MHSVSEILLTATKQNYQSLTAVYTSVTIRWYQLSQPQCHYFIIIIVTQPARAVTSMHQHVHNRQHAALQWCPTGWVKWFCSWLSHLFHGRQGGQCHVRSGGQLSGTLMWSWRATFASVSSLSRATSPNTEMHWQDRRWDSEVRPIRCSTSSFRTRTRLTCVCK